MVLSQMRVDEGFKPPLSETEDQLLLMKARQALLDRFLGPVGGDMNLALTQNILPGPRATSDNYLGETILDLQRLAYEIISRIHRPIRRVNARIATKNPSIPWHADPFGTFAIYRLGSIPTEFFNGNWELGLARDYSLAVQKGIEEGGSRSLHPDRSLVWVHDHDVHRVAKGQTLPEGELRILLRFLT